MENTNRIEAKAFKELRKHLNFTQKDFAKTLELTQGYISDIETGRTSVSYKVLKDLYTRWGYNPLYHMTGIGSIIVNGVYNVVSNIASEPRADYKSKEESGSENNSQNLKKIQQLETVIQERNREIKELQTELSKCKDKVISLLEKSE